MAIAKPKAVLTNPTARGKARAFARSQEMLTSTKQRAYQFSQIRLKAKAAKRTSAPITATERNARSIMFVLIWGAIAPPLA